MIYLLHRGVAPWLRRDTAPMGTTLIFSVLLLLPDPAAHMVQPGIRTGNITPRRIRASWHHPSLLFSNQ
jgi:hypothetical protein